MYSAIAATSEPIVAMGTDTCDGGQRSAGLAAQCGFKNTAAGPGLPLTHLWVDSLRGRCADLVKSDEAALGGGQSEAPLKILTYPLPPLT